MTNGIDYNVSKKKEDRNMTDTTQALQDQDVEWRLLNKLLLAANRDYINRLSPALFTGNRRTVYEAMQNAFREYGTISYDGVAYFMSGKVPGQLTAANSGDLQTLLDQAIRLATKRMLKDRGEKLLKLGDDYNPSTEAIQALMDFEPIMAEQDSSLALGAQSFLADMHAKRRGEYIFAKTGFKTLDRHMGGEWKRKGLVLIAGGAGSGKTTLYVDSQLRMAKGYALPKTGELIQTPSLFISLEMDKAELMLKMVSNELSIDSNEIVSNTFGPVFENHPEWETEDDVIKAIEDKTTELQDLPIYVVDNSTLTLSQIVYEIRKHVQKYGVRVVAIDYLQLINHHPTGNDNNDLGEIAIVLKALAKKENITIILLSQINRGGEGLNAIRDSGEVQAVVDVVMQLIPDEDDDAASNTTNVNVGWWKNRGGRAGKKTPLLLNGAFNRFIEG